MPEIARGRRANQLEPSSRLRVSLYGKNAGYLVFQIRLLNGLNRLTGLRPVPRGRARAYRSWSPAPGSICGGSAAEDGPISGFLHGLGQGPAYEPLLTRAEGVLKLIPKLLKNKPRGEVISPYILPLSKLKQAQESIGSASAETRACPMQTWAFLGASKETLSSNLLLVLPFRPFPR
jgi:hypothetical protein